MNSMTSVFALIGRILLAAIFLWSGFDKIGGFQGLIGAIASKGFPVPEFFAAATIALELIAGAMLVAGWKVRWAALALAAFTLLLAFLFHNFWAVPEAQKVMQQIHFMKNMGIVGGLLYIAAFGAGRLSVDKR